MMTSHEERGKEVEFEEGKGTALWEAHAPKYGVTSLIPGFRHFDAVHVLKCGCSLQNQRLEQATPTHSLDYT